MVYRVIISHAQTRELFKFPKSGHTVVVFDAPTKEDMASCSLLGYTPLVIRDAGNRGVNRNYGLSYILDNFNLMDSDIIEFLDGDRYPANDCTLYNPDDILNDTQLDCLLYTCQHDTRIERFSIPPKGILEVDTGLLCNPFYSCGFIMRVSAIHKVLDFNGGYFFEPQFNGWGCEDQYLGVVCHNLGLSVGITRDVVLNGQVGGDSIGHPEYRDSLQVYIDLVRQKNFPLRMF